MEAHICRSFRNDSKGKGVCACNIRYPIGKHVPQCRQIPQISAGSGGLSSPPSRRLYSSSICRRSIDGCYGFIPQAQASQRAVANLHIIVIFGALVARAEVNFHFACGVQAGAVMRSVQGAVQQFYAIKIGCVGNAVNLFRHCHKFGMNDQTLR